MYQLLIVLNATHCTSSSLPWSIPQCSSQRRDGNTTTATYRNAAVGYERNFSQEQFIKIIHHHSKRNPYKHWNDFCQFMVKQVHRIGSSKVHYIYRFMSFGTRNQNGTPFPSWHNYGKSLTPKNLCDGGKMTTKRRYSENQQTNVYRALFHFDLLNQEYRTTFAFLISSSSGTLEIVFAVNGPIPYTCIFVKLKKICVL